MTEQASFSASGVIADGWLEGIEQRGEIAKRLREIITLLGLNPDDQHFASTPQRVAKVLTAYVQPVDFNEVLSTGFDDEDFSGEKVRKGLLVQTDIPFMGLCAHHLLPFFGKAAVGYVPSERLVGLSKLTRLVYAAGHVMPSTQEQITDRIATALDQSPIRPQGVAVITSALHGCMAVRGVESPGTRTIYSAVRGVIAENPALESKFTRLAQGGLE